MNGHIKFNLTIPLQQLNGLETLVIIMVANKYAFLQITRRRFLNEWEAFKKVISRRNIRRRITIPLTLSNLKLLRRITRTENILHRNFTRRQVAIQNRVASNIGISQSTFSVKVLNLFSRSRRKTNKRKSKHSAMLRPEHGTMFTLALVRFPPTATKEIQYLNAKGALTYTDIAGDPVLYGNLPPREISMKDVFRSGDSSKKFKIAEGQWYRYAPSYVSPAYHLLEGFPFIQEPPSGDLQERVLIRHHDYDQCFQ